jgi:hypothetical protein
MESFRGLSRFSVTAITELRDPLSRRFFVFLDLHEQDSSPLSPAEFGQKDIGARRFSVIRKRTPIQLSSTDR